MTAQIITAPNGERLVVLPETEYLALVEAVEDTLDREAVRRFREALEAGEEEFLPSEIAERLVEGENPVRVWREYRGLTTSALAKAAGLSQPYVAQIETGKRAGTVASMRKLAAVLRVGLEDIAGLTDS